jgi:glutathione S-transferase
VSLVVDDHELAVGPDLCKLPRDIERRAEVESAVDQSSRDSDQPLGVLVAYAGKPVPSSLIDDWLKLGYAALAAMEKHLSGRSFLVAERYTIADIALYSYTHVAHEGGFDLAGFPALRAWLGQVAAQPGHEPITA